jgi:hypothetical protein
MCINETELQFSSENGLFQITEELQSKVVQILENFKNTLQMLDSVESSKHESINNISDISYNIVSEYYSKVFDKNLLGKKFLLPYLNQEHIYTLQASEILNKFIKKYSSSITKQNINKDLNVQELTQKVSELYLEFPKTNSQQKEIIIKHQKTIQEQNSKISKQEQNINQLNTQISQQEQTINQQKSKISQQENSINEMNETITKKEKENTILKDLDTKLNETKKKLQATITQNEITLHQNNNTLSQKE